jgi:hypothetical protein
LSQPGMNQGQLRLPFLLSNAFACSFRVFRH